MSIYKKYLPREWVDPPFHPAVVFLWMQIQKWRAMGSDWCHVCGAQALPEEKVVRRIGFLRVRGRLSELPFVNIPEVSISYKYSFITGINIIFIPHP